MVKVYSGVGCGNCARLKSFLKNRSVEYEELVVGKDIDVDKFVSEYGVRSVPVLNYKGTVVVGFDEAEVARVLAQK